MLRCLTIIALLLVNGTGVQDADPAQPRPGRLYPDGPPIPIVPPEKLVMPPPLELDNGAPSREDPRRHQYARSVHDEVRARHLSDDGTFAGFLSDIREIMSMADVVVSIER